MLCPKCGGQVPNGSKFCPRCGTFTGQQQAQPMPGNGNRPVRRGGGTARLNGPANAIDQGHEPYQQYPPTKQQGFQGRQQPANMPQQGFGPMMSQQPAQPAYGMPRDGSKPQMRFVEAGIAIALIVSALFVPVLSIGTMGIDVGLSTINIISILMKLGEIGQAVGVGVEGQDLGVQPVVLAVLIVLLLVGIGSMVMTAVVGIAKPQWRRINPFSWGMVVYGIGMLIILLVSKTQIPDTSQMGINVGEMYHPAIGLFVMIAGAIACGVVDILRSKEMTAS